MHHLLHNEKQISSTLRSSLWLEIDRSGDFSAVCESKTKHSEDSCKAFSVLHIADTFQRVSLHMELT
jgi:hypothetical protein